MFGSTYILSPRSRFFWGLGQAFAHARKLGGALSGLADAIESCPVTDGVSLAASSVFHQLWVAALANHVRHGSLPPAEVIATGLRGLATELGITVEEEIVALSQDSRGHSVQPEGPLHVVEFCRNGVARRLTEIVSEDLPIVCIGRNPLLETLMGDFSSPLSDEPGGWISRLRESLHLLAEVSPEQYFRCVRNVKVVAGLDGPFGQLHSVSIGEWPGGVALRGYNPPPHICDSFVHETAHQLLDFALAESSDVLTAIEAAPASYSPFFEQPRPALKVWHGIVSYLEVLRFWEAYLLAGSPHRDCDRSLAESRAAAVREMCLQGICSVRASTSPSDWPGLTAFIQRITPIFTDILPIAERELAVTPAVDPAALRKVSLSPIEYAEVLLALEGHKVSRISLSPAEGGSLARSLPRSATPLFSRHVHLADADPALGSFSNRAVGSFEYHEPPPNAFVHVYISRSSSMRRMAALLDERGEAGDLFDIPSCCRRFFSQHWDDSCRDWNGDLASQLLAKTESGTAAMSLPWQLNVFAMYHGYGLTWHFPCDLACGFTTALVSRRSQQLATCDESLRDRLVLWQQKPVIWSPRWGIVTATQTADGERISLREASPLRKSEAMTALMREDYLFSRGGDWVTSDGRSIRDIFDPTCRVLTWY